MLSVKYPFASVPAAAAFPDSLSFGFLGMGEKISAASGTGWPLQVTRPRTGAMFGGPHLGQSASPGGGEQIGEGSHLGLR